MEKEYLSCFFVTINTNSTDGSRARVLDKAFRRLLKDKTPNKRSGWRTSIYGPEWLKYTDKEDRVLQEQVRTIKNKYVLETGTQKKRLHIHWICEVRHLRRMQINIEFIRTQFWRYLVSSGWEDFGTNKRVYANVRLMNNPVLTYIQKEAVEDTEENLLGKKKAKAINL